MEARNDLRFVFVFFQIFNITCFWELIPKISRKLANSIGSSHDAKTKNSVEKTLFYARFCVFPIEKKRSGKWAKLN